MVARHAALTPSSTSHARRLAFRITRTARGWAGMLASRRPDYDQV
jgi:hypothetical protein